MLSKIKNMFLKSKDENKEDKVLFSILEKADKYGVIHEVLTSAFIHRKHFPNASLLECLQVGADEWDV